MGERPEGMTLDRIDSSKGYSEKIVVGLSYAYFNNRQTEKIVCYLTYKGITQTAADWSRSMGLTEGAVWQRIAECGMDIGWTGSYFT